MNISLDIAVMLDELGLPLSALRWKELLESPEFADFTPGQLLREIIETQYIETMNRIAEPLTAEQRYPERQKHSKAVLDEFFAWAEGLTVSGGTKLAKAVSYAKSEKKYLYRFLESGEIPIDNNRAENAVRPFCVGRKNWLFSASVKGAEASAMMYSIAATACANGMNVEQYLTELFRGEAGTVVLPW